MMSEKSLGSGVAAGFITLVVAMGIGRFLYTPLLPLMLTEYGIRTDQAGFLASLNYIGYLVGAFSAGPLCHRFGEHRVLAAGLFLSCLTTASTGFILDYPVVCASRLLAGNASALAFVSVSGVVLLLIAHAGRENLAGLYYGGVGAGIVATGLAAPPVARVAGAAGTWVVFGAVSAVLSVIVILLLRRHEEPRPPGEVPLKAPLPRDPRYLRLVIAYGLEGFGYIITGTFMVAAAKATVGAAGAQIAWVVAGCAAFPSAYLWSLSARKWGRIKPLAAAFLIQGAGIVLPSLGSAATVVVGALLYGATFMGIVTLALSEGASYAPTARARVVGFMTGIYGIGQIVGPALAGHLSSRTGSYHVALGCATAAVLVAGLLLLPDAFGGSRKERPKAGAP